MKCDLDKTQVVYHQDADAICIGYPAEAGVVLHPVNESALNSMIAWICRDRVYEPRLYRIVATAWRSVKKFVLRRAVSQGKYERIITGKDGSYIVLVCEHYATEPVKIPFLRRPLSA